jgi:O-succinylbenzoic acid--CoA ligase
MPSPFTTLTIDGRAYRDAEIDAWADALVERTQGAGWCEELRDVLRMLTSGDGSITARTSGTTGEPKELRFSASDLRASARLTGHTFHLKHSERALLCLPCNFIAGRMMLVRGFVIGLDLHVVDPSGPVLEKLDPGERFRFAAMVPQQLHRALQDDRQRVEKQFDTILLGGGPVSAALEQDISGLNTRVVHSYGSTETLTHVALRELTGGRSTAVFTAIGDISFDEDAGGCLIINTPHLSIRRHVTNDLVDLMDDRHFVWRGRYDNMVLSGGRKINPEALEARTAGIVPYAHYFAAYEEEGLGQGLLLVVASERSAADLASELNDLLQGELGRQELPRRLITVRHMPRTSSGKIRRTPFWDDVGASVLFGAARKV